LCIALYISIIKKESIPVRRGELTSADRGALALGNESETTVGIPSTERSRKLVEQVEQSAQATSLMFKGVGLPTEGIYV
jgi:hypothetical protein